MKTMLDLEDHHCRYVIGDPDGLNTVYCGERVKAGSSLCPEHHAVCWVEAPNRKKKAA